MSPSPSTVWKSPKRWISFVLTMAFIAICFRGLDGLLNISQSHETNNLWISVLPPLLAVVFALHFKSLFWALSAAFVLGSFLSFGINPTVTIPKAIDEFIFANLFGQFNLYIFGFLLSLVGMIQVCVKSGGIDSLVAITSKLSKSSRSVQFATLFSGFVIFFDDYSNTVVVGRTMRKLSDHFRVSREKLAYIVDSTTAPIAGLALISTWIAFEVFLLGSTASSLGLETGGYGLFVSMIPYRFYCLGTLLFLFINISSKREWGPMWKAEKRARLEGKVIGDNANLLLKDDDEETDPKNSHWIDAVLPVATVLFSVIAGILLVGKMRLARAGESFSFLAFSDWQNAFGRTVYDPSLPDGGPGVPLVLFWASIIGSFVAILLPVFKGRMQLKQAVGAYLQTSLMLRMAFFILLMAWSMKSICDTLGTSTFLVSLMGSSVQAEWIPILTFLLAAGMAFSIGTSWGTMGVMIPVMLPLIHQMAMGHENAMLLFLLTSAAVLDGAIFGDHCSPISDTTVLSSISAGCDHIAHVTTQLPYALITMLFATAVGYLPASFWGIEPWLFWVAFPLLAYAFFRFFGKPVPTLA